MINTSFLKKLKKRLHDLLEHYQSRINTLKVQDEAIKEQNLAENTGLLLEHLQNGFT